MAAFTSNPAGDAGNWNDGATWGNSSPGSKGTDWPGNAGDTFTISAGDTVTYNVSETNELGASTINGTLTFKIDTNTKLTFGHVDLTISGTGKLIIGTQANPIAAGNTAELYFNTTSDGAKGIVVSATGAEISMYGSDQYTTETTTLANDSENTDGDTSIKTVDDMSADWAAGDEIIFTIEKTGDSSTKADSPKRAVIQSISGTTIVLDINVTCVAGVGSTWTSTVYNITRNVKFGKLSATLTYSNNTNRPYLNLNGTYATCIFTFVNTDIQGIYRLNFNYSYLNTTTFNKCVIRNGGSTYRLKGTSAVTTITNNRYIWMGVPSENCFGLTFSDCAFIGNTTCFLSSHYMTLSSCVFYGNETFTASACGQLTGTSLTLSNNYAIFGTSSCFDSYFYNCIVKDNGYFHDGGSRIKFYGGSVSGNTYDFSNSSGTIFTLINTDIPSSPVYSNSNTLGYGKRARFEHYDTNINSHRIVTGMGNIYKTLCDGSGGAGYPDQDPNGNTDTYCIEASSIQSGCTIVPGHLEIISRSEPHMIWIAAGTWTITYKVMTTYATGGGIADNGLVIAATYISDDSPLTITRSTDSQAISTAGSETDWTQTLAITITTAAAGWVEIEIYLTEYEANNEVFIWPVPAIT